MRNKSPIPLRADILLYRRSITTHSVLTFVVEPEALALAAGRGLQLEVEVVGEEVVAVVRARVAERDAAQLVVEVEEVCAVRVAAGLQLQVNDQQPEPLAGLHCDGHVALALDGAREREEGKTG